MERRLGFACQGASIGSSVDGLMEGIYLTQAGQVLLAMVRCHSAGRVWRGYVATGPRLLGTSGADRIIFFNGVLCVRLNDVERAGQVP